MQSNKLFLTPDAADKSAYIDIMTATARAVAAAMDHPRAYAGMEPYALREALHTDELLPAEGCDFAGILADVKDRILPNLLRPMSTDYMAHLHSPALLESIASSRSIKRSIKLAFSCAISYTSTVLTPTCLRKFSSVR